MARPNSATERELIKEQLTKAKETLARLRQISDSPRNGETNTEEKRTSRDLDMSLDSSINFPNGDTRNSSRSEDRASSGNRQNPRISTAARDNFVHALGYQVSKLEDDLKDSLLSYFEQVERQKEDLIDSFNVMQRQLLRHQQICQEQTQDATEKDVIIRELKTLNRRLEAEVERLNSENERYALESSSFLNGLDSSMDSLPESLSFAPSSQNNSGYSSEKSDVSEKLMRENARLRGLLRQQDNLDSSRLERKVDLQQKLCHSYDKDLASKDILIKRLKAENKGLQNAMQSMEEEVLRVNASRFNAEKEKTGLQQEIQFKDEQFLALREKLAEALEDRENLKKYVSHSNPRAKDSETDFSNFEDEIVQLQNKCDTYKDKLNDKEKFINSMKNDGQEMSKALDIVKKEVAAAKSEAQRMKRENERLQRENADRDIDRLSTESSTKASNSTIIRLKDKIADLEDEVRSLQRKGQEAERRETDLSQDVLSNLEKFTRAEQELYTTKKELAQLRGFYESSEKRKKELQNESITAREKIVRLEKELRLARDSRSLRSNRVDLDELEGDNRRLRGEISRLNDALNSSKSELDELENAIESSREQISIQKVRLDGNETMIMRKDERIKELQEELVDLHNQNDALTDEILRKNREMENMKMGKLLAEQERELLKTGKLPARSSNKDPTFSRVEPSTPDSGYSETDGHTRGKDRDKAIEQLRRDIAGNNRDIADESLTEEEDSSETDKENGMRQKMSELMAENTKLKEQEAEMIDIISDMEGKLSDVQEENQQLNDRERNLKQEFEEKENDMTNTLDDINIMLSDLQDENSKLKEKEKKLEGALKKEEFSNKNTIHKPEVFLLDQLDALESTPVMDLFEDFDSRTSEPIDVHLQQKQVQVLEAGGSGQLVDFGETPVRGSETENEPNVIGVNNEMSKKLEDLRKDNENYETQLEALGNTNQVLEAELEETREMVKKTQKECKQAGREKNELQNILRKETAAKEAKIGELQKELKSSNKNCNDYKSQVEKLKANSTETENKLRNAQAKCAELENKAVANKKKHEEFVEKAKEEESKLLAELGQTKTKMMNLENDTIELQNEEMQSVNKCRELQRENRNLEEQVQSLEKEKNKLEKKLKELNGEKDDISQKWEETKRNAKELKGEQRRLQEEKEDLEFEMNEMLKQKNREIKNLEDDVDMSKQKCDDLKSTWNNYEKMSSDFKGDLIKAKEECIDLTNENEKLYAFKKELVKELEDKDKLVDRLKNENEELQNNKEKELEKMRERVEELQEEKEELKDESEERRKVLDLVNEEKKDVEKCVQQLQNDKEEAEHQFHVAQESITDLEHAFGKSETENAILKEKLNKADRKIAELQKREENAQNELMEAEKRAKAAEKKVKELNSTLQKSKEDIVFLENKQAKYESTISSLEDDHSKAEEQQKVLQRKLLEATNQLSDLETQETENTERHRNNDKKLADLRHYNEELEAERDDLEFKVKDLKKKLDKEKKRVDALEDELAAKKMARDCAVQELGLLKSNLSETENEQTANLTEKEKLKREMLESSKRIMDLEVEIESQKEQIEELEKLLDQKRATVLDMEDNLKESTESTARLQAQHGEDTRMLKSLKEDNTNLEKMLEKQKQLSEGYKNSLSQKDSEMAKLTFSLDDAEDALQLQKKDLARREGVNKANREELEDAEKQLANTSKKLQETKYSYDKVVNENERLQKDLDNARRKLSEMEGRQVENVVSVMEVDPLYSRKSSSSSIGLSGTADGRIKTLDDKLTKAQTKVTDLENELSKEIRRHEIDCIKTRPSLPYTGKRSGYYDVSGMNAKYGSRRSDSSDSELSGSADDILGKNRGLYRRKSVDSTEGSLDRGSDFNSKGSDKGIKAMSANTPKTLTSPVFSFDLSSKPNDRDQRFENQLESMTQKQSNDSFSETSSRGQEATEDVSFDHSIGNLNELISEFNEAEKQDPLLQKFLLDQSRPDGTSSPHDDSFDLIQPTYISKRQNNDLFREPTNRNKSDVIAPPSEQLLDFGSFETASDITSVTDVTVMSEPIQNQNQFLLDLDPFSNINEKQTNIEARDNGSSTANNSVKNSYNLVNEEPGVFDSDLPNDVIDPFSTPFDIPNWDEESNSSFEGECSTDFLNDNTEMDKPVLILINDQQYDDNGRESSTGENSRQKEQDQDFTGAPAAELKSDDKASDATFTNDITFEVRDKDDSPKPDPKRVVRKADSEIPDKRPAKFLLDFELDDNATQSREELDLLDSDIPAEEPGHLVRDYVRLAEENKQKSGSKVRPKAQSYTKPQQAGRQIPDIARATQVESTRSNQQNDQVSDDEEPVFRKPSDIIKQLEQASFSVGKPGMKQPRPKQRSNKTRDAWVRAGNDEDVDYDNEAVVKPDPKPRGKLGVKKDGKSDEQGRSYDRSVQEQQPGKTPEPKQRNLTIEKTQTEDVDESEAKTVETEDRNTAMGRLKIMSLIATFEGKEV